MKYLVAIPGGILLGQAIFYIPSIPRSFLAGYAATMTLLYTWDIVKGIKV